MSKAKINIWSIRIIAGTIAFVSLCEGFLNHDKDIVVVAFAFAALTVLLWLVIEYLYNEEEVQRSVRQWEKDREGNIDDVLTCIIDIQKDILCELKDLRETVDQISKKSSGD